MWGDGMKKWIGVLLISCILFLSTGCQTQQTTAIGLVPLDSRPCNTQYAVLLGEMAGYEVLIPEYGLLDAFTIASDTDALWQWLDKQQCEHYILFTNQLLNGGLINSRSLTQYQDMDTFFTNLERFIAGHTDSTITILSVLPRLLPSQYDTALWQYQKELATYGGSIDQALQQNQPLPSRPDGVPEELVDQYLALYQTNYELIQRLMSYTDAHVSLVIGQDDAQQYCPSNIVYRAIGEQAGEHVTLLHGADELTMLTLARYAAEPVALNIVYSDETFTDAYYPYEGADLASIIAEKAAYANITVDSHAQDTVIIYTDSASLERTTAL